MWLRVTKNVDSFFCNLRDGGKKNRYQISLIALFAVRSSGHLTIRVNFQHWPVMSFYKSFMKLRLALLTPFFRRLLVNIESNANLWIIFKADLKFLSSRSRISSFTSAEKSATFMSKQLYFKSRDLSSICRLWRFTLLERVKCCVSFSHHQNDNRN